jgi:hypothetical protein
MRTLITMVISKLVMYWRQRLLGLTCCVKNGPGEAGYSHDESPMGGGIQYGDGQATHFLSAIVKVLDPAVA